MAARQETALRAWSALLSANALALRAVEARMKAAGLPPLSWYDVLLELDRAGGRCRIGELAERAVIEPYNMTRLLDRLEGEGLIARERSATDRRSVAVVLTEAGATLRRKIWPTYREAILAVMTALGAKETEGLDATLRKLAAKLRGDGSSGA